jgi:H+/Cl- antiporter ClcA
MISTFGGGSLGREGPSVQIAASIFAVAANKLRKFFPRINLQNWVFAGCGVGFAVAFCAPFAGFIYVIEKLFRIKTRNVRANISWTFLTIVIVGIILYEVAPLFVVVHVNFLINEEAFLICFIAIFCAILAVLFLRISFYFYKKIIEIKSLSWHLAPIIAGLLVSIVSFYGGVYSIGGGIKTVNDMLASDVAFISSFEVFGRIVNTSLTFIAGCAGGLVAPAIAIGAGIGSIFSSIIANVDAKIFILCGMTSFLTVVMNMPLTAAIIILETTSQSVFAFPFLFSSALISFFSAKLIDKFKGKISGKFFQ